MSKCIKGIFFLLNSLVMLGKLSNGNFNPNIWLATKFSSKEQLVVVVCLLCYCNIQAGFHHGTINEGKSDDHYNGNVRDIRILFLLLYSASLISSMCGKKISLKAYLTFLFVTRIDVKLVMWTSCLCL